MSDNEFFGGRRRRRGNGGAEFSPFSLFANSEQGLWYDPSDLATEKTSWRRNLLTYSQDFENAAWTKSNASILSNIALYSQDFDNAAWNAIGSTTITANTIVAPDGTTTADLITASAAGPASAGRTQTVTFTSDGEKTFSVYLKVGDGSVSTVAVFDSTAATMRHQVRVTWTAGVPSLTSLVGAGTLFPVQSVGNGWYRIAISATGVVAANSNSVRVYVNNVAAAVTGNSVYVWGAQAENAITPGTYTRSLATAAPIQFSDPLGGTMADKLVENTANANHFATWSTTLLAGVTYTLSAYAKAGERTQLILQTGNVANWASSVLTIFNLDTGTIASGSGTITPVGSGWYRCSITATFGAANATGSIQIITGAGGAVTYTGDGVSGIYVFGAQVEQASTASAYQRITNFSGDFSAAFPNHSLYQESTGPSPVTALGQSVGLTLDRRLGGIGSPLVANGTFSDGTGWTFGSGWSLGNNIAAAIATTASATYAFTSVSGAVYRVQFDVMRDAGTLSVRIGSGTGVGVTTNGTHVLYVVGGASTTVGVEFYGSASFTGTLDNVIVQQVFGNHAIQATSASRPTLQARANLLTATEDFNTWSTQLGATVLSNQLAAPDGTITADLITGGGASESGVWRGITFTGDGEKAFSLYVKAGTSPSTDLLVFDTTASVLRYRVRLTWTAGVPTAAAAGGAGTIFPIVSVGNGWYRISFSATGIVATNANRFNIYPNNLPPYTGNCYFWGAQAEDSTTVSTYQRVVTATDYADVGLPRNLLFDGVDDSLATTGNVDFSATDKMSVFSGLTKTSDAAQGIVTELTASAALNTGAFNVQAPSATPATNRYAFESKGSLLSTANVTSATYAAPRTDVVTMTADIGTDALAGRINGASVVTSATDQGTGNFANAVVYVGRRGGTTLPLNGRIFQLIVRGAATDSVTVINAEQYVAQKTGVTL